MGWNHTPIVLSVNVCIMISYPSKGESFPFKCAWGISMDFWLPYGYESKYKVWIKAPDPHMIHTPRSIPWSIPHDTARSIPLIHTPDPYPWSVPLSRWRKTDAGPNAAFYPNTASGLLTATPVATTVASTAASAASAASVLLLLVLLPLLVIFLPGAAATAVASAAAPAGPAPAAGSGSLPPCASGSWTNATSWLATSNTASAPWRLGRHVLVPLGASCTSIVALWLQFLLVLHCLARVELDQARNTPLSSFTAIAGKPAQIACPDPYPDPYPFHTRSIPEPSHATGNANMKVRFYYYFYCCCCFYFYSYYYYCYYYCYY